MERPAGQQGVPKGLDGVSGQPIRWRSSGGAGVQPAAWPLMASRDPSWLEAQAQSGGRGRAGRRPCCPLPQTKGSSGASQALGQGPHPSRLRAAGHRAPCPPLQLLWQDWWPAGDHVAVGREPPSISARAFLVSHTVWTRLSSWPRSRSYFLFGCHSGKCSGTSSWVPALTFPPPPLPPGRLADAGVGQRRSLSLPLQQTQSRSGEREEHPEAPGPRGQAGQPALRTGSSRRPPSACRQPPVGWVGAGWRQPGCLGWRGGAHSAAGEEALRSHVPRRVWPRKGRVYAPARSAV